MTTVDPLTLFEVGAGSPGSTDAAPTLNPEMASRLLSRAVMDERGCWLWTGGKNDSGYGMVGFRLNGKQPYVHRLAYELFVGPIPADHQVDHLCRVRHCLNPAHLEVVTLGENVRRGESPAHISRRRDVCQRGHSLTDAANVYVKPDGRRSCRACRALYRDGYGGPHPTSDLPLDAAVRLGDPDTSAEAARQVAEFGENDRGRILAALRDLGGEATTDQLREELARQGIHRERNSLSRRISDLRDRGLVVDSGRRSTKSNGRPVIVWKVTGR